MHQFTAAALAVKKKQLHLNTETFQPNSALIVEGSFSNCVVLSDESVVLNGPCFPSLLPQSPNENFFMIFPSATIMQFIAVNMLFTKTYSTQPHLIKNK